MADVEVQAAPDGFAPGENGDLVTRQSITEFVGKIQCIANMITELNGSVPVDIRDKEEVRSGLQFVNLISTALEELIRFSESPLGRRATRLLWQHLGDIRTLAEIGAGAVIAAFFLVVGQDVLDVTEDEFHMAKRDMENCISFVREKLESIRKRVDEAVGHLRELRMLQVSDEDGRSKILKEFDESVRLAELDIAECEDELKHANDIIVSTMEKINVKIYLNGAMRGGLFAAGGFMIYHLVKTEVISLRLGIFSGLLCTGIMFIGLRVPRYRKLQTDFEGYKQTQAELSRKLRNLKIRVESNERVRSTFQQP